MGVAVNEKGQRREGKGRGGRCDTSAVKCSEVEEGIKEVFCDVKRAL